MLNIRRNAIRNRGKEREKTPPIAFRRCKNKREPAEKAIGEQEIDTRPIKAIKRNSRVESSNRKYLSCVAEIQPKIAAGH